MGADQYHSVPGAFLLERVDTLLISVPISYPPLDISFVHITLVLVHFPKFLNKFLQPVKIRKKYRKNPVTTEKPISKYDNISVNYSLGLSSRL
jgi:hypothetical protein